MRNRSAIDRGLYVITDCEQLPPGELFLRTQQILDAGIVALQYRDKTENKNKMEIAMKLKDMCRQKHTLFIINDDVELANELQADGVHVGRDDSDYRQVRDLLGEETILGLSCYNEFEKALEAQENGVDYIAFGSVFPTNSKKNTVSSPIDLIKMAKQKLDIPVAAIGGITPDNCIQLIDAGVDLLAVISSVYQSPNPYQTVKKFNHLFL